MVELRVVTKFQSTQCTQHVPIISTVESCYLMSQTNISLLQRWIRDQFLQKLSAVHKFLNMLNINIIFKFPWSGTAVFVPQRLLVTTLKFNFY